VVEYAHNLIKTNTKRQEGKILNMIIGYELLEELANEVQGEARASYSGRGMYGRSCVGIVIDSESDLLALGVAISELVEDYEDKQTLVNSVKTDSMGRGLIAYWTGVTCEDAPDEDEEEDE
jgi:hypothetical protein